MGLGWVLVTLAMGAQPTEFRLDTDTPDALCPELQLTRDAVKKRLGKLEVEGGGRWEGRYTTVHDPTGKRGDFIRLVIVDPSGKEQMTRDLPMRGESCATMAQAISLVVDSFFRDFGQSPARDATKDAPAEQHTETIPAPTPPAAVLPPPKTATSSQPQGATTPPRARSVGSAGIVVGGGYESVPSSAAADIGLFSELSSRWRLDLHAAFPVSRMRESFGNASAYLYPIPLRLSVTYQTPGHDGLMGFVGPELLLSVERGWASGAPSEHQGWRESFGAGARAGAAYWISPRLALSAAFSFDGILVQSRRFLVIEEPALEASHARLAGTLELWGAIFP